VAGMMEGKVVVVTGAGGGIGREIAIMMAAAGARVIIADVGVSVTGGGVSETPAQQTREIIRQGGGTAEISTDSVAEWGSAQRIIQSAIDHFGRIVHRAEGWTPETIAQHAIPAVQSAFMPLDTSEQAFPWDPV
jgi:NAD(P)-dependent dehydrogenase (short-subunit alcohol dehydrogenase family)